MAAELAESSIVLNQYQSDVFMFGVGASDYRLSQLSTLDNTPQDGVPQLDVGDYEGIAQALTKALPTARGAIPRTVRISANPEFSNLDTVTMQVTLQLEVK
jgi:hypothetical protein